MKELKPEITRILDIKKCVFDSCGNILSAYIKDGTVVLPDNAFSFQNKLENVFLPDSVKVIQHDAFYGCNRLHKIRIPEVDYIGLGVFDNCDFRQYCDRYFAVYRSSDPTVDMGSGILIVYTKPSLCFSEEYGNVQSLRFLEILPDKDVISPSPSCQTRFYVCKWNVVREYSFNDFIKLMQNTNSEGNPFDYSCKNTLENRIRRVLKTPFNGTD